MLRTMARKTLCAVVGSTGVGKSQLSIDLAKALNGEVINGDSMQVYRGADIITNKVTKEEIGDIKHHLLGFLDPRQPYDVSAFTRDATEKIDEIHNEGKWPILVGGTHYYLQSLLFKNTTVPLDGELVPDDSILSTPTEDLFFALQEVDPDSASRLHPSDRRKIQKRLELYLRTGKPASEVYKEQAEPEIRWETLVFWIWSDRAVLNERLDRRVDKMIEAGVEEECRQLHEIAEETDLSPSQGIFQAIGYREFVPVVSAPPEADLAVLRTKAIEEMKSHTRQYVLRQLSWIKHQLIPICSQTRTPIYILDATDPSKWSDRVLAPALRVARAFINQEHLPSPTEIFDRAEELLNPTRQTSTPDSWKHWACEICGDRESGDPMVIVGSEKEWNLHLSSRRHKSREKARKKRKRYEEWLLAQAVKEGNGDVETI